MKSRFSQNCRHIAEEGRRRSREKKTLNRKISVIIARCYSFFFLQSNDFEVFFLFSLRVDSTSTMYFITIEAFFFNRVHMFPLLRVLSCVCVCMCLSKSKQQQQQQRIKTQYRVQSGTRRDCNNRGNLKATTSSSTIASIVQSKSNFHAVGFDYLMVN